MTQYRALRIHQTGNITPLIESVQLKPLAAGDVLIDAHYSSINYKDALAITGKGKIMRKFPTTAGIDVSGVVEASEDARFQPGDKVLVTGYGIGEDSDGGFAEKVHTRADYLVPLPENYSLKEVMMMGTAGFTAGLCALRMLANHQTPELGKILVTGATGGVGSIAVRLMSTLGFEVAAATSKVDKAGHYLMSLGASELLDRNAIRLSERPLESVQYGGAIDTVGGNVLGWLTRVIAPFGNIACCGLAGSAALPTTVMPFILRGINLLGIHSVATPMNMRREVWALLAQHIGSQDLMSITSATLSLDEVINKAADLMQNAVIGRYVVDLKK